MNRNNINLKNSGTSFIENYKLNREIDFSYKNKNNDDYLNDRDLFNKFSNNNNEIDISKFPGDENNYGMPIFNGQILNNKKNLLSNPYIVENNKKDNFISSDLSMDSNDMYEELENKYSINKYNNITNLNDLNNFNDFNDMAYNNKNQSDNFICKLEKDITISEYESDKNIKKEFLVNIHSPFALGYLWKTIILLSKNPTTDKILKLLNIKNKESIINDMKNYSYLLNDICKIDIIIPESNEVINSNFINKIEDVYNINITMLDNQRSYNTIIMNLKMSIELEIPYYYNPQVIFDYMVDYNKNKLKFIELMNVPVILDIDRENDIVLLEIPFNNDMMLGFIYTLNREVVKEIPYEKMIQNKKCNYMITKLIIPKINRNKKNLYSKKYDEICNSIHFGELIYGKLYNLDVNTNTEIEIKIINEITKNDFKIEKNIDSININHKCYYYIRNNNIKNKILISGIINY